MSMTGTVLRFDTSRGFGFVEPSDGSPDVFVHERDSSLQEPLYKGDKVSFDIKVDEKKNKRIVLNCQVVEYSASRPGQTLFVNSCVSDQSRLSTCPSMNDSQHCHSGGMTLYAPNPALSMHSPHSVYSPQNEWELQQQQQEQQLFYLMQQQQQQHLEQQQQQMFFEQQQFLQQEQEFYVQPTTIITTVFVEDVNMYM